MTLADRQDLAAHGRAIIEAGSKSFAAASMLFDRETRLSAHLLYAWCRRLDDQADGQDLGHHAVALSLDERRARVDALYAQTRSALAGEPQADPVFAGFQAVVRRHGLPERYVYDHLAGFRLDADGVRFPTLPALETYCYHVAGVVGLMMAWIMGVRDEGTLDRACDLGLAFQLTNVARDVIEDAGIGRVYLPETWLAEAGVPQGEVGAPERRAAVHALAVGLVRRAEPYYASARWGMKRLPFRSATAVGAARGVYRRIGRKLVAEGPAAWDRRLSTGRGEKGLEIVGGAAAAVRALSFDRIVATPERGSLWTRPGRSSADGGRPRLGRLHPIEGEQAV